MVYLLIRFFQTFNIYLILFISLLKYLIIFIYFFFFFKYLSCILRFINIFGDNNYFEKKNDFFYILFSNLFLSMLEYLFIFIFLFMSLVAFQRVIFLKIPNILCLVKIRPACTFTVFLSDLQTGVTLHSANR